MASPSRERRESAQAIGPGRAAIIRTILQGERHRTNLAACCKEIAKGETFDAMLARMVEDGLLVALRGNSYAITDKARDLVAPSVTAPMVPYVAPPPAWRRPGSDHSHIPSLAGGQLLYR